MEAISQYNTRRRTIRKQLALAKNKKYNSTKCMNYHIINRIYNYYKLPPNWLRHKSADVYDVTAILNFKELPEGAISFNAMHGCWGQNKYSMTLAELSIYRVGNTPLSISRPINGRAIKLANIVKSGGKIQYDDTSDAFDDIFQL